MNIPRSAWVETILSTLRCRGYLAAEIKEIPGGIAFVDEGIPTVPISYLEMLHNDSTEKMLDLVESRIERAMRNDPSLPVVPR